MTVAAPRTRITSADHRNINAGILQYVPGASGLSKEDADFLAAMTDDERIDFLSFGNAGTWAEMGGLELPTGVFSFDRHEYLMEVFSGPLDKIKAGRPRARKRCYIKSPQGGFSITEALINLHGMKTKKYPQGVLHLLPTKQTVEEFGKSKYGPIIAKNKTLIGRFVKAGARGVDSAAMKQIHDAFLYLRSATVRSDTEGDGKESATLSSISVDKVIFDEQELIAREAIAIALGRMDHSEVKEEVYIGNPGGEDSGIDLTWKQSDMRHWFRKCTCVGGDLSQWQSAEKTFPECVREYPDADERERDGKPRGYIACQKCGKPLPMWAGPGTGMWIPDKPSVLEMEGYRWSHLSSTYHDPVDILKRFIDPPYGDLGGVYRMSLGLPYSSAEDKLRRNVVMACCGNDLMRMEHTGPCAMGMDVGLTKHIIIGTRTDKDRSEIVRVARIKSFDDAYDLCRRYNVKMGVVDIRPYEDEARAFQQKCKQVGIKIFLCQYVDNPTQEWAFNDNNGIVKVYRTGVFDMTHRYLTNGNIILPRQNTEVEEFADQCCNAEKYSDTDRNGAAVMRYRPCGNAKQGEHYRNALNYFLTATKKVATFKRKLYGVTGNVDCIMDYKAI